MKIRFRVGFHEYKELDLSEEQVADLLDFVLNGEREFNHCGSIYLTNEALISNLKNPPLSCNHIEDYKYRAWMQK